MNLRKFTLGDAFIVVFGLVFLVSVFMKWVTVTGLVNEVYTGWNVQNVRWVWVKLPLAIVVSMLMWIAFRLAGVIRLSKDIPSAYLLGGSIALALPLYRLLTLKKKPLVVITKEPGLFLSLSAAALLTLGGLFKLMESRRPGAFESEPDQEG